MTITDINVSELPSGNPDLKDRVYLVTGAAGAIGGAVAAGIGISGGTAILVDRNSRGLDTVYDRIVDSKGAEPVKLELDLASAGMPQYEEMADLVGSELGRLDGIIHCAVEPGTLTPLSQYPLEQLNKSILVNFSAPYMLTRCCLELMKQSDNASVIFTTSDVAREGKAYWGAYSITGHATEALAQIWADELETNTPVRLNTLDPGPVKSLMRARFYPGEDPASLPAADSVVPAYLYLLGEGVTGKSYRVTGNA
jgi:NAD(P)-dependent dehydrogenase (short-subunit alcohol dehydrogenase family)